MTNPDTWRPQADTGVSVRRAALLARAREYFAAHDVLEVDTPSLSFSAVSDPAIESLRVDASLAAGRPLYLCTSPEFAMKRLLAAGYPDIYQIGRVYRDNEAGRRHQPEFTLAEWYRRDFDLDAIVDDTLGFLSATLDRPGLRDAAMRFSYRELFVDVTGVDPLTVACETLAEISGADARLREALADDRDAWLDLVLSLVVVPKLATDRATVISHYPASQASLARLCPQDARFADRFEVFVGDMELANGFVELTDAQEQRRRFEVDLERRRQRGQRIAPLDDALLQALDRGLPECAGVAVGIDRVLMVDLGVDDIRETRTFAFEEAPQ